MRGDASATPPEMNDEPVPTYLRLHATVDGGPATLRVEGEIDLSTAEPFRAALVEALTGRDVLHVDLRAVSFMDSTGLRALLEARRRAEDAGAAIALGMEPEGPVERLLELAGVTDLFARSERAPLD
jgi:anti-anti-sigma factor